VLKYAPLPDRTFRALKRRVGGRVLVQMN
jgi:hypothetical protein